MKECERFKDFILTDYIDGELDKKSVGDIESHLLGCRECRFFLKEVKNSTAVALQQALHEPPAELWDMVRQGIEQEKQGRNALWDIFEQLKGLTLFPKMVPVFASLILMFLAGSVTLSTLQGQRVKAQDQGEYLVALLSSTGAPADSNDQTGPIEHYFL